MRVYSIIKAIALICLLVIVASMPIMTAQAAAHLQDSEPPSPVADLPVPTLPDAVSSLFNLGGIAALFAAIINALKTLKIIPDGKAPTVSLLLNLAALVGLVFLQIAGKADIIPVFDKNATFLAQALTAVVALVYQLYISQMTHKSVLAGLPLVGKSYSDRAAGQGVVVEVSTSD